MLRANHAVRVGLRAASRNPEIAFARALLDQAGNLLALLPLLLAAALVVGLAGHSSLPLALRAVRLLTWPTAGALLAAAAIACAAGMLFWSGALPLLAADEEMDRRPPSGHFAALAARGFARVLVAAALGYALPLLFESACLCATLWLLPAIAARGSPGLLAAAALVAAVAIAGSVLFEVLGRLLLVRAAAFGEGLTAAFGKAASLLLSRLGACVAITFAFVLLDLIVAAVAGLLTGMLSGASFLDADAHLLALAPRIAVGVAAAVVFSWLEVGRMAAFAALALDAEGLIAAEPAPVPVAEPVVEALPADEG